jgi:predicted TIM-barrel fold metal-dependent hydrolase
MGFAPYGNAAIHAADADFWRRDWIDSRLLVADLGPRLDAALDGLFAYCVEHDVPVMAHSAPSNAPAEPFQALAGATFWAKALARHPALRINFGHFGDTAPVLHAGAAYDRARAFTALMNTAGAGRHAYADAGYFVEAMSDREPMQAALQRLYTETQAKGDAALSNRFLYGTDWEMIIAHGPVASYLTAFEDLFERLQTDPAMLGETSASLSAKFFGANAVTFTGLGRDGETRRRLQRFYDLHRIKSPDWMAKADRLAARGR